MPRRLPVGRGPGSGPAPSVRLMESRPYRDLSFWHDSLPDDDTLAPRPALPGDTAVDVAIVGGGYTGLWTALYLLRREPTSRVVVLDAEVVGFGASGRNGGWCSALLPTGLETMAKEAGRDAAIAMQRTMFQTVDEVGRIAREEGIDCHYAKGGYLHLATSPAHTRRLRRDLELARRFDLGESDVCWLTRVEAKERVAAAGVLGALYTPHCAAIHPARLVRGLAKAVERAGGVIHEETRARVIRPGKVTTEAGVVRADVVVRAAEGFTRTLRGERRTLVPLYSLMIATEPLSDQVWAEIGLRDRETFNDARHLIIYGQRTADGRLAFGGRGAPYHFGSAISPAFDRVASVHDALCSTLRSLFPVIGGADVTHRWGGPLGVARDWQCSVGLDRRRGLAWAGGYVGDGVSTSNLAGRTLADLISGDDTELTRLPWVDHRSRKWEPEPLRWMGISAGLRLPISADQAEWRTGRPARVRAWATGRLLGH
jgi:glycine/D-amino acid oxidase-like deaminating enzyme